MSETRVPKQPLHPSVVPRLDPQYAEFHNAELQYITPPHTLPWDPAIRNAPAVPGGSTPLKVGQTKDFDLTHTKFRSFTPEGEKPAAGWPVFIFFHGGRLPSSPKIAVMLMKIQVDGRLVTSTVRTHSELTCVSVSHTYLSARWSHTN